MTRSTMSALGLAACLAAGACTTDIPTATVSPMRAIVASRATVCVRPATTTVADEASLHAALANANPGDVIAVSGMIDLVNAADMETPGVTLTCAEEGAGLRQDAASTDVSEILVRANDVTVRGLVLDASQAPNGGPIEVENVDNQHFENNTITCSASECGFWASATNTVITDNVATETFGGPSTGFHLQTGIDGSRIERNTLTATVPTGVSVFGGLRVRDGHNVHVADNVVTGPWSNSLASVNLSDSRIERNTFTGAQQYGFALNRQNAVPPLAVNNVVLANHVRDAGTASYYLAFACYNAYRGNASQGTSPIAMILTPTTGANQVVGTTGSIVDSGAQDCDGDGNPDPNTVHGGTLSALTGAALHAPADSNPSSQGVARRR